MFLLALERFTVTVATLPKLKLVQNTLYSFDN